MIKISALSAAVIAAVSFHTSASQEIERITVTANKIEQSQKDVLAAVSVIDRADIERSGARDLATILSQQAGIQINANGSFGHTTTIALRGGSSDHTLVLIDGVRVGSATLGYKSIEKIPLQSVERVEIVKGSRAAIYGSDAMAGVINIITRRAEHTTADVTVGSNSYRNGQVATSYTYEDLTILANLGHEETDNFDVLQGTQPDSDGHDNTSLGLKAEYQIAPDSKLFAAFQGSEGDTFYDNPFGSQNDTAYLDEYDNQVLSLGFETQLGQTSHAFTVTKSQDESVSVDESKRQKTITKRTIFNYDGHIDVQENLVVLGGVSASEDDVSASTLVYEQSTRDTLGVFVGSVYEYDQALVEATVRYDDDDQFGSEVTHSVALGYKVHRDATFRFAHNTGYKAPTFNDLYYPGSGNPALLPEESDNFELGLKASLADTTVDFAVYRTDYTNKIAWAPNAQGNWAPANIDNALHQGLEVSVLNTLMFGIESNFNYAFVNAKDESKGKPLPRIAKHSANWLLSKQWNELEVVTELQFRGQRDSSRSTPTGEAFNLSSYTLVNLAANYELSDALKLSARVENLFDKEYGAVVSSLVSNEQQEVVSVNYYNTPERRFFVNLQYRF
ncbi:TonB-dependent receptor [Pseudoalteromonas sp. Of7M-16]|uniref:TonB-dependent receptor domain-containing protein n=1 Tax=Pseudoalteromonas sp. Of7M-16 TaxID=2917756 RepID=UPI001EF5C9FD|nr:TonB-dependent receptor [Pseudoalteromonas sp. Of7M-16]MCG7547158.1 TonB-dependent receptor [Pseudoalteromonas sp. Of7M-16]